MCSLFKANKCVYNNNNKSNKHKIEFQKPRDFEVMEMEWEYRNQIDYLNLIDFIFAERFIIVFQKFI